jgi:hypothetical protein
VGERKIALDQRDGGTTIASCWTLGESFIDGAPIFLFMQKRRRRRDERLFSDFSYRVDGSFCVNKPERRFISPGDTLTASKPKGIFISPCARETYQKSPRRARAHCSRSQMRFLRHLNNITRRDSLFLFGECLISSTSYKREQKKVSARTKLNFTEPRSQPTSKKKA